MVEFLQALGPDGWGTAGGLVLVLLSGFIFGKIIPQSTHERELKLWQDLASARKEESDGWRSVAEELNGTVSKVLPQLDILVEFFNKVDVVPREGETHVETDSEGTDGTS
jgi:hypothetical protein